MKKSKENWIQEQCINEDMSRCRSNKREYKILKILTHPTKTKTRIIEDHNHKLISDK